MGEKDGKVCFYCTKCGAHAFNEDVFNEFNGKCHYCNTELKQYDLSYYLQEKKVDKFSSLKSEDKRKIQKSIYKSFILNQQDFDMNLFKQRNNEEFDIDLDIVFDKKDVLTIVECPYCHSNDTKKISGSSRILSGGIFGFGSSKIGKQWHCNTCKSDF